MRWLWAAFLLGGCGPTGPTGQRVVSTAAPPLLFCTRTLGLPQCFADPANLADHPTPLADTPVRPPAACTAWWQGDLVCRLTAPAPPPPAPPVSAP